MIITSVDEYFLRAKVSVPYPSVLINSENVEALPVVLGALEPGDVSVVFQYEGRYNIPKAKISRSILVLAKLLSVYPFTLMLAKDKRYDIKTTKDLLDVGVWSC